MNYNFSTLQNTDIEMLKEKIIPKEPKSKYIPSSEFYSQIIDSLQDYSVFTLDKDLKINSWNSGSKNIFGWETDEIIGESFGIIFTKEDLEMGIENQEIQIALSKGRATDDRWHVKKDNSRFFAHGLVFPHKDENGEIIGFVKILRDLTEMKKSEKVIETYIKDLEELNTHKESVLSIISHDLRTPLTGIIGLAMHLKENIKEMSEEELDEMLELLLKTSREELAMLDYLVDWARVKYANEAFTPQKISLTNFVQKVFDRMKETAQLKNINLVQQIDENETVFADQKMLLSVFQNLISNAIKHTDSGGEVKISTSRNEKELVVQVKDSGKGMSKKILEKLFKPQLRALSNPMKKNKGAGIGLLLSKGFLERNGGKIWVESVEGGGSSFFFTLPISKPINGHLVSDGVETSSLGKNSNI
ncbi:PAS domain-containing sensor histidine kinase [Aquiflexum lacus]|uniref:PAS domain-containing sensor histidine kinase n=1 Tax=Aquiflexum lacus TaxID=2483805 RepID=UPI001894482D|nr:PAS domain-containing sensor histidine kinase [Aquiflexum lacus]